MEARQGSYTGAAMNDLIRRSGRYSARVRVPVDLVNTFGKSEMTKAPGRSDLKDA